MEWYRKAVGIEESLRDREPDNLGIETDLAYLYSQLAVCTVSTGEPDAVQWAEKAVEIARRLLATVPHDLDIQGHAAGCFEAAAAVLGEKDAPSAFEYLQYAFDLRTVVAKARANDSRAWRRLGECCLSAVRLVHRVEDEARWRAWLEQTRAAMERATRLQPRSELNAYVNACVHAVAGDTKLALDALEQAIALGWRDAEEALEDKHLDGLREQPRFRELIEAMRRKEAAGQRT